MKAKELILSLIEQSELPDAKYYHSRLFLKNIEYQDVMDIVLYYIYVQDDLDEITKILCKDFSRILERTTKEWAQKLQSKWGTVRMPVSYRSKQMRDYPRILLISSAWDSGITEESMTIAVYYRDLQAGFANYKYLLAFFRYPEGLPDRHANWPWYKENVIKAVTFAKWNKKISGKRSAANRRRLETVFDLAEAVCQELRKRTAE